MTATMTLGEHLTATGGHTSRPEGPPPWARLAIAGAILMGAAGAAAIVASHESQLPGVTEAAAAPFPTVGTSATSYPSGHSSGWHVHPGFHSVVVLSGTLTVYDETCARSEYRPGETYLGGSAPHIARNEASDVLDVAITFVYRARSGDHGSAAPAPAGCELR